MPEPRWLLGCLGILLGGALVAREDPHAPARSSIEGLIAEALANNAELRAFDAALDAAKGGRTQAGFFQNPTVSFDVGGREVRDSEDVLQGNGTTFGFTIAQTFEFPGKGTLRKAIANKNVEIAELGLQQFRLALAGQVRLLAYEHLAAASEAAAAESVYAQSRDIAAQFTSQSGLGARLTIETRLLQASLVELGAVMRTALTQREDTRTRLNALLGRMQDLPLRIRDPLSAPARKLGKTQLVFAAQARNPLLRIRSRELERSARELAATRLDIAPDFAIGPFFSRDVAGDTETNIGASISATIPVWDWNIGNIQSAKARLATAEALRVKAERDAEAEILSRIRAYEFTRQQLGMIPADFLAGIRESPGLAGTQLLNGSIDVVLYLDTQTASLGALRTYHAAVLDAWRTLLDLNLLSGGHVLPLQPPKP